MKKIFLITIASISFMACEDDLDNSKTPNGNNIPKCTMKGRWHTTMNVLYEFTDSFRYTFYKNPDGKYGTLQEGSRLDKKKWWMEGDSLVIDQNGRGTSLIKTLPKYSCDCNVFKTDHEYNGSTWTNIQWKEGHDTTYCK